MSSDPKTLETVDPINSNPNIFFPVKNCKKLSRKIKTLKIIDKKKIFFLTFPEINLFEYNIKKIDRLNRENLK